MKYFKKAETAKDNFSNSSKVAAIVQDIIKEVATRGESAVRDFSKKLDNWNPESFLLSKAEIKSSIATLNEKELSEIRFAQDRIAKFAQEQKKAILDLEYEISPGVILGHKQIPISTVACYVPAGSYPLIASASMSVVTAKVAGVKKIVATTPPNKGKPHPSVVAAMHLAGADEIYSIGGAQALAAMAFGIEKLKPVDLIVGPGNAFVAEAKRQLFGRVGIDLLAGPTETMVIADDSVDGEICAVDLLGQAEHGVTSPAVLITNSEKLAKETSDQIEILLKEMPTREIAAAAWRDYGMILVCDDYAEMVSEADKLAFEHVQVMTENTDYFLANLSNYGALFLGARTNVAYGDKVIGTNHTLPTNKAARYTGGLWVGKFLKTCTYQRIDSDQASSEIGEHCSYLSTMEGFAGHAEQANIRIRRYGKKTVKRYSGYE